VEVNKVAGNCRNPSEQEKLYGYTGALNNMAVQLKIMASVRAASKNPDPKNNFGLTSVTGNMGNVLKFTLASVTSAKLQQRK